MTKNPFLATERLETDSKKSPQNALEENRREDLLVSKSTTYNLLQSVTNRKYEHYYLKTSPFKTNTALILMSTHCKENDSFCAWKH